MILIDDVELIGSLICGSSILEITIRRWSKFTICSDANIRPVVNNKGHEVLLQLKDFNNISIFQQLHKVSQKFRNFFMLIFL